MCRTGAVSEYENLLEMCVINQGVKVQDFPSLPSKNSKPTASNSRSTGNRNYKDLEWANSDMHRPIV
jgi:hypothetical protein